MSCFRLIPVRHLRRRSHFLTTINPWTRMESIQEKSKLADERIQQLKSLVAAIGAGKSMKMSEIRRYVFFSGPLDPEIYVKVLQDENTRLKARVENLVKDLITLENQRGGEFSCEKRKKISNASSSSNTTV